MSRTLTIVRTALLLPLVLATPSFGETANATLACIENAAADTTEATGYIFSKDSKAGLFSVNGPTAGGAPTFIYVVESADTLASLNEHETLDGQYQWTGLGSRAGQLLRVRSRDDNNKIYQIDLASMKGAIIQGSRSMAQLSCQVRE